MGAREKEMWEYVATMVERRIAIDKEALQKNWSLQKNQIISIFMEMLKDVTNKCTYTVDIGSKGIPAFVVFSFLNTAFITEDYCIQLDVYDTDLFLDAVECNGRFRYDILLEPFHASVDELVDSIKKEFVRCTDYELNRIKWEYKDASLFELCFELVRLIMAEETVNEHLSKLSRGVPLHYMYGYYLNKQQLFEVGIVGSVIT